MLKHLLKACGILAIVFLTSTDVTAQSTTLTIKNNNADCRISYEIVHSDAGCSGTLTSIYGSCNGGSVCYETIPAGEIPIKMQVVDLENSNYAWVQDSNCGSTTSTYTNCDNVTSYVSYDEINLVLYITP
jgi:hypothetical protein